MGIDWEFAWTKGKAPRPATDIVMDLTDCSAESLYFGVFIKTSNINDETRDSMLPSDSLIRSSYSWETPRVTVHDNDTPRSLINTLGTASLWRRRRKSSASPCR